MPPTPGQPTPPLPQRTDTLGRHPTGRSLPGVPPAGSNPVYFDPTGGHQAYRPQSEEHMDYEDLMKEVEAAVMGDRPSSVTQRRSPRNNHAYHSPIEEGVEPPALFSASSNPRLSPDERPHHTNGHLGSTGTGQFVNYDAYDHDSEAEAEAGMAALQMLDEQDKQEAADIRRRSGHSGSFPSDNYPLAETQRRSSISHANPPTLPPGESSDSDIAVDVGLYGGGYSGSLNYGGDVGGSYAGSQGRVSEAGSSRQALTASNSVRESIQSKDDEATLYDRYSYSYPDDDASIHPFPSLGARVDTGGTGGLSEPSPHGRRRSYDEGDEDTLGPDPASGRESPEKEDMPDLFYHPGMTNRPLPLTPVEPMESKRIPQLMPAGTYQTNSRLQSYDQQGRPTYPVAPDAYSSANQTSSGTVVPRSTSLSSHSSTPQMVPPIRSKTDAEERRLQRLKAASSAGVSRSGSDVGYDSAGAVSMGMPTLPIASVGKRFNPAKLSTAEFKRCTEPWALSSIVNWIRALSEEDSYLKQHDIVDGIVALFTHKVPTMNTADAETLGERVVRDMLATGTLLEDEEWVKFGDNNMSGVLFQITGIGCYAPQLHVHATSGRCYSHHCMRTLKKVNLQAQILKPEKKTEDWVTFYKLTKPEIEAAEKKEVERQNILHEIVTSEDLYMSYLEILRVLYRDQLQAWKPPIIESKRLSRFIKDVFGKVDAVKKANEEDLLPRLKYRQQEQGPWIVGFSDIFREWIRQAKTPYIEYAAAFPNANRLIRTEAERNVLFRQFLDQARDNKQSQRLAWDTYLKSPITRLQRYTLLLNTVHKNMLKDNEEKRNLEIAIEEIKAVTMECDAKVAEMSKKVDLLELGQKLKLRPAFAKDVELNLNHLGREIVHRGDLQRIGSNRYTFIDTHAILFDHYLVLAKPMAFREGPGHAKTERYDVSKMPIPMDLLILEGNNDEPVVKSKLQGVTAAGAGVGGRAMGAAGGPGPGTLAHTSTNTSLASVHTTSSGKTLVTNTVLNEPKDEKIMYPFRVKHLGRSEVYTLYSPSAMNRQDWCDKIIEAKTRHAASLYRQNAEPFRLRVLADTAFGYDTYSGGPKAIVISGTPLDRAIREAEINFAESGPRPGPICRAAVNCATSFMQPYGNKMCAIGTDYGVYVSEYNNPRGWTRVSVLPEYQDYPLTWNA